MFPSGHQDAELVEIPSISPRGSESLAYTVVPRTSARVRVLLSERTSCYSGAEVLRRPHGEEISSRPCACYARQAVGTMASLSP